MDRPLLPPRGVFVPAQWIYNPRLPPAALHTWMQLRGLAWGRTVMPPISMQELAALTGKCQATIYGHMSLLRNMSALSWRTTGQGKIIVSFADKPSKTKDIKSLLPELTDSKILESKNLESGNQESASPLSLNPPSLVPPVNPEGLDLSETETEIQESQPEMSIKGEGGGERECEGERGCSNLDRPPATAAPELISAPVSAYRSLTHLTPNVIQRRLLTLREIDLPLWQSTLEHWLFHGWNPRNLAGMLDLYDRGGPAGCRQCHSAPHIRPSPTASLDHTLSAIASLRKQQDQAPDSGLS